MKRYSEYPILDSILNRWSARAMSGESLTDQEVNTLFEAARWAPSSFNNQPWRFVYVRRDTPAWDAMFDLLVSSNKQWAVNAGILILVTSANTFSYNNKPSRTHSFDTGAAVENLALQGSSMGLVVHGMEGFDYDKARSVFNIPQTYTIEALFAVGKPGPVTVLPEEMQKREQPSDRKKLAEIVQENNFTW
jgi:nitroreductase